MIMDTRVMILTVYTTLGYLIESASCGCISVGGGVSMFYQIELKASVCRSAS